MPFAPTHRSYVRRTTSFLLPSICVLSLMGCHSTGPQVTMSDPAVFTTAHIRAAERAFLTDVQANDPSIKDPASELSLLTNMRRQWATTDANFQAKKLRLDDALDSTQSFESQLKATALALRATAAIGPGAVTPTGTGNLGSGPLQTDTEIAKAMATVLASRATDSPFDRLERTQAFYSKYTLALLRLYGHDSRVINMAQTDPIGFALAKARGSDGHSSPTPQEVTSAYAEAQRLETALACGTLDQTKVHENTIKDLAREITQDQGQITSLPLDISSRDEAIAKKKAEMASCVAAINAAATTINSLKVDLAVAQTIKDATKDAKVAEINEKIAQATSTKTDNDKQIADIQKDITSRTAALNTAKNALTEIQIGLPSKLNRLHTLIWGNAEQLAAQYAADHQEAVKKRLVLLMLQVHVTPGNIPDQMAGIRARISACCGAAPKDTSLLYAIPGRTYDISDQLMASQNQLDFSTAVNAVLTGTPAKIGADSQFKKNAEAKAHYLSRISKQASYTDAATRTFGWNFYPSNIQVENGSAIGHLEAGSHDCAIWLIVPNDCTSLTLSLSQVSAGITGNSWRGEEATTPEQTIVVPLPTYNPLEQLSGLTAEGAPGSASPAFRAPLGGASSLAPQ